MSRVPVSQGPHHDGRPRLLVTGSRLLTRERHADAVQQGLVFCGKLLGREAVLVHGDCAPRVYRDRPGSPRHDGLDRLARDQWLRWGLDQLAYPADWAGQGVAAGHIRNEAMVRDLGMGPAICMAWPHPDPAVRSGGTWDCVRRALAASVTVLSGWTCTPILSAPDPADLPPRPPPGMLPHHANPRREVAQ